MKNKIYDNLSELEIENFWKFISIFTPKELNDNFLYPPLRYREYLIKKIKKKYTINQFYKNEKILNELLYKLLKKYSFYLDEQHKKNNLQQKYSFNLVEQHKKNKLQNKILLNSYSHKLLLYNEKTKTIFINNRSSDHLYLIISLLRKREIFENAMNDINYIKTYKFEKYYYPDDYGFPNVNFLFYNENSKKIWLKNIKRLYYTDNCEENWRKSPYLSVDIQTLIT
jgi:hypothetical protein